MNLNLQVPAEKYDLKEINLDSKRSFDRLQRLICHALDVLEEKREYEVCDKVFNYGLGESEVGSRYGINFHLAERVCVVFATQRDIAYPIAFFPLTCSSAAARYFVWLASEGSASINWELFGDMEPRL